MKIYTIIDDVNEIGNSSFTGIIKEQTTGMGNIIDA